MQQFPHDGDVGLQGCLPAGNELVEEGSDAELGLHRAIPARWIYGNAP